MFYSLVISRISKFIIPLGTLISAISPTALPSKPLPIGESTDILPYLHILFWLADFLLPKCCRNLFY